MGQIKCIVAVKKPGIDKGGQLYLHKCAVRRRRRQKMANFVFFVQKLETGVNFLLFIMEIGASGKNLKNFTRFIYF